tara:strand:- start:318 stop:953 length:636 start_codon:yes stop_codon:yes gene_type:complete
MILFLDTISPLPEFSLIEDNKIIYSKKILIKEEKLSNSILPAYVELDREFLLSKKLQHLITCTGPGSYTALRIGIAFFSGLSLSLNIPFIGISCIELYNFLIHSKIKYSTGMYIVSSKNQKYICIFDKKTGIPKINKIENINIIFNSEKNIIKKLITNVELINMPPLLYSKIVYQKLDFKEIISKYIKQITSMPGYEIIQPIYISDNKILN